MTIIRRQTLGYVNLLVGVIVLAGLAIGVLVWQESWQNKYAGSVAKVANANTIHLSVMRMGNYGAYGLMVKDDAARAEVLAALDAEMTATTETVEVGASFEVDSSEEERAAALESLRALSALLAQ
jgi:hypothetical protein